VNKTKRFLLATAALTTSLACGGKKTKPEIYSNPKGPRYDMLHDAGADGDAPAPDEGSGSGSGSAGS
jgi:hypothetical protein